MCQNNVVPIMVIFESHESGFRQYWRIEVPRKKSYLLTVNLN
jgi:hypothetical protein